MNFQIEFYYNSFLETPCTNKIFHAELGLNTIKTLVTSDLRLLPTSEDKIIVWKERYNDKK